MVKNLSANAGDVGLIPGLGRSPGEGNGNPLQYSCLGNPMDRRAWQTTVHGVAKNRTWLRDCTTTMEFDLLDFEIIWWLISSYHFLPFGMTKSITFIQCLSCLCSLEVITYFLVSQVGRNCAPWYVIPIVSPVPYLNNTDDEILDLSWSWNGWNFGGCWEGGVFGMFGWTWIFKGPSKNCIF